jgi:hypothetical protein
LGLFTFGEYKAFLNSIGKPEKIGDAIVAVGATKFRKQLEDYSEYVTLKLDDLEPLRTVAKWKDLADLRKKKFTLDLLKDKGVRITDIIRYFNDWQQSKDQWPG